MERPIALPPRFRLIRPLGSGARGQVVLALDSTTNREVALKLLHQPNDDVRKRFPTLRAIAQRTPGLVALDAWIDDDAHPGFTMAPAAGASLAVALRGEPAEVAVRLVLGQRVEQPRFDAPSPALLVRTRHVFGAIAVALRSLHDAGFVHGDLRPENVLVDVSAGDRTTVLDLDGARPAATRDDGLVATAWSAPELDLDERTFTPACDVYALGTLLFFVLTGDVPFSGSAHDVVLRKGTVSAPHASFLVRGIPDDLDALAAAMLERAPSRRATIPDVLRALDRA